ncbi:MAG: nucleoside hydrolase [Alteromonadaceae bacterium]|nr:nucleoside hydrolase [Alteromonadaceae bacterium]
MAEKVIIDTDPGIDDAMAIFFAFQSPDLDVLGLTTTFGNVPVSMATRNALTLCEIAGKDIPVCEGVKLPWVGPESTYAHFVHGDDGFGNINHPTSTADPDPRSAAQFIIDMAKKYPGEVTLVAIGPLGNLAMALKMAPEISTLLKGVVIMGGAAQVPGNVTPVAEANIWNDPYAADIAFSAQWPFTMIGLDVTYAVSYTQDFLAKMAQVNPKLGGFVQKAAQFYVQFYSSVFQSTDQEVCYFHDAMALAYVIDPTLFEVKEGYFRVATDPLCYGQTTFAPLDKMIAPQWEGRPKMGAALSVDKARLTQLFLDTYAL